MKTFICTDHTDTAKGLESVVVAKSEQAARAMLDVKFKEMGVPTSRSGAYSLEEIEEGAYVLRADGIYRWQLKTTKKVTVL